VNDSKALTTDNNYNTGQLVDFLTAAPGELLDCTSEVDPTQYANSETYAPFEGWMQRFVRIGEFPWSEQTGLLTSLSPYNAYLTHPSVLKKLEGFSRFHMKGLELKFLINGAPTQYGTVLVSYQPLPGFAGGNIDQPAGSVPYYMGHTCYPHTYLSVATSMGATMKVPFVCPKNCLSVRDEDFSIQATNLGLLSLDSIGILETVGIPSSNPIVVTVYARPIDLFLWGPTTYVAQSDEYGVTPVSTIASVVASAAGMLATVPSIRPYMLATQLASGAVASIARLFGYSNPPVIEPVHVLMNRPTYGLSSPAIPVQMDKLALDPKNELTVDPRTVGAPAQDAMSMSYMMDRDVYLGAFKWYGTDVLNDPLLGMHVTPEYCHVAPLAIGALTQLYGAQKVQMTPSCHLSQLFKYWRGPIHYTFTAIASQFHRGRYVIEYEPAGRTVADGQGLIRQWVVDIKDTPTFRLSIDMCSDLSWLPTARTAFTEPAAGNDYFTPRALQPAMEMEQANGTIRVRVLNDLASSDASTAITMFVRANCKDVEFACPMDVPGWPTTHTPQSDVADLAAPTMQVVDADESVDTRVTPHDSVIYHGEVVKSIRTLLQRATFFQTLDLYPAVPTSTVLKNTIAKDYAFDKDATQWNRLNVKWAFPRIGMQVGYPGTQYSSKEWSKANAGATYYPFVFGKPTNIAYLSPCYVGYRGSVGYRAVIDSNTSSQRTLNRIHMQTASVERTSNKTSDYRSAYGCLGAAFGHTEDTQASGSRSVYGQQYLANTVSGASGIGVTNDVRYLDAMVPHYSRYRMLPGSPAAQLQLATFDAPTVPFVNEVDNVEVTATFTGDFLAANPSQGEWMGAPKVNLFQQAGVDLTFLFYLAPPTMYTLLTAAEYTRQ
jgi:hypothetical protein